MHCLRVLTLACLYSMACLCGTGSSAPPEASQSKLSRPESLTVTVGEMAIRIDGPKLWTLSRIDYRKNVMAIEDSAYGSIFTIRDVGTLGSAHFLDVPGKPGEVEKEDVMELKFFLDDQPVTEYSPKMTLSGQSFRMNRRSKIRSIDVDTNIRLKDGVLIESARVRSEVAVDLRIAGAMMYAWTPTSSAYLFGDDEGIRSRGTFLPENAKPTEGGDKAARWMAVYDPVSGQGSVSYVIQQSPGADAWIQFTDAPGVYRKMRLLYFPEQIMPAGFDGTFETATAFFATQESEWETKATQLAGELKSLAAKSKQD